MTQEAKKAFKNSNSSALDAMRSEGKTVSLEGESFEDAHMHRMDIEDANFSNTEWTACILEDIEFKNCDFSGSYFNGTTLQNVVFENCVFDDVSIDGCVLQKCILQNLAQCEACELVHSQFKDCTLHNLDLSDATWDSLTFTAGKIEKIRGSADLRGVVLRNVEVQDFDTTDMELQRCTASGVQNLPKGFAASRGLRQRV